MARFYNTSSPTFVDNNIFQLPYELMGQVLAKADKGISDNQNSLDSYLNQMLQAKALEPQSERLGSILSGYESKIDSLAKSLQENPLEFKKKSPEIRSLGRELFNDFSRGEIASIQSNYNKFNEWETTHKENKDILNEDFLYARNKFLSDFSSQAEEYYGGGMQGQAPTINTEGLNKYVNVENIAEERGKGYADSVIEEQGFSFTPDGRYIINKDGTHVPYEKVFSGVLSALKNDKELNAYLSQQYRLGKIDETQYANAMVNAADRVASKYSFTKTKQSLDTNLFELEAEKLRNKKSYKKWEDELKENKFSPITYRTTPQLEGSKWNYEGVTEFSQSLQEDLDALKNVDTSSYSPLELKEHNYNISQKESALINQQAITEKAIAGSMRMMLNDGKISQQVYNDFVTYDKNKQSIDAIVNPVLSSIEDSVANMDVKVPGTNQSAAGIMGYENAKQSLKSAIYLKAIQDKMQKDPKFAEAYRKYEAGNLFKSANQGSAIQLVPGLQYTEEEPNKYLNKWFKENGDSNVLYSSGITVDSNDKEFVNVLDNMAKYGSSEARILSYNKTDYTKGGTKPADLSAQLDIGVGKTAPFTINEITRRTGKEMSQLFNIVGIEPSADGSRIIYEYDKSKFDETGIDEIEGLNNGDRFMVEFRETGIESFIADKYKNDKNTKAVEITKAMLDPVYMQISNQVDNTIKDITSNNFQSGPNNTIFVDGLRLSISSQKSPNGNFIYTIQGYDNKNGTKFPPTQTTSTGDIKISIRDYINNR